MIILCAISLSSWLYILFGRAAFWRVTQSELCEAPSLRGQTHVVAIVPARNEAAVIGRAIQSLLKQQLDPKLRVIVVDDASEDGTGAAAREAAGAVGELENLTVLKGQPLLSGWTGKLWALSQGVELALALNPDYLLFTDADIVHGPGSVQSLVNTAVRYRCDLASVMVKLACESFAEKALIPAFVFFFLQLYPPAWIKSRTRKTAGAAGGCLLIRPQALARIGGLSAIRDAVIDDCTLAKAVKRAGGQIWMGLTAGTSSIRSYQGFFDIGRMISRTAFSQLNHSVLLLIGTVVALLTVYVVPVAAVFEHKPGSMALGGAAWMAMTLCYAPTIRFYKQSWLWSLALPAIAVFYIGATLHSAIRYWTGKGGQWKGRLQDARL